MGKKPASTLSKLDRKKSGGNSVNYEIIILKKYWKDLGWGGGGHGGDSTPIIILRRQNKNQVIKQ